MHLLLGILFIVRVNHLVFAGKIDPEVKSFVIFIKRGRHVAMYDSFTGSHNLQLSGLSWVLVTSWILMIDLSFLYIINGLNPPMWMLMKPWRQFSFSIIKNQKGIKAFKIFISNNSKYFDSWSLIFNQRLEYEWHHCK